MRQPGGYPIIVEAIEKLSKQHKEHIARYGEGNERRLTGRHETASFHSFSYGVANRGAPSAFLVTPKRTGAATLRIVARLPTATHI